MKTLLYPLIPIILFTHLSYAGQDETTVQNTAQHAAESNLTNAAIKTTIDSTFQQTTVDSTEKEVTTNATDSFGNTVGADALAVYSIYQGMSDFSKAQNDKQKGFAAAEVAAGIMTIVVPPAGAIASISVQVIKLTVTILDMQNSRGILEIEAQTLEIRRHIVEQENKIIKGEIDNYTFITQSLNVLSQTEVKAIEKLKGAQCVSLNEQSETTLVRDCIGDIDTILKIQETEYSFLRGLINTPFPESGLWEQLDRTYPQFSREKLTANADNLKISIQHILSQLGGLKELYYKAAMNQFIEGLNKGLLVSELEASLNRCAFNFQNFIMTADFVILREASSSHSVKSPLKKSLNNVDTLLLTQQGDEIAASECADLDQEISADKDQTPYEQIAFRDQYLTSKNLFQQKLQSLHHLQNSTMDNQ